MAPVQQSRIMEAEQRISAELVTARGELQQLSRLQAAAQEVRRACCNRCAWPLRAAAMMRSQKGNLQAACIKRRMPMLAAGCSANAVARTAIRQAPFTARVRAWAHRLCCARHFCVRCTRSWSNAKRHQCMQDLFGNDGSKAAAIEAQRATLRERIRRIHAQIVALPAQADANTRDVAERIKRAKATALNDIAAELNRQEIQALQAQAHKGAPPCRRRL